MSNLIGALAIDGAKAFAESVADRLNEVSQQIRTFNMPLSKEKRNEPCLEITKAMQKLETEMSMLDNLRENINAIYEVLDDPEGFLKEEVLNDLKEFVGDCAVSHEETRYKYKAQALINKHFKETMYFKEEK